MRDYEPRASLVPGRLDFTACPYMWPHCRPALYHGAMPFMFNATVVNGMGLTGWLEAAPVWTPTGGTKLMATTKSIRRPRETPGRSFRVFRRAVAVQRLPRLLRPGEEVASGLEGVASGVITFTVLSPPGPDETTLRRSTVRVPVKFQVVKNPAEGEKRAVEPVPQRSIPARSVPQG